MLSGIEDQGQHFTNWGSNIFDNDCHVGHCLFCYRLTSKPKRKFIL